MFTNISPCSITEDLSSCIGTNSWYLCRPLSECRSLFDGEELGYFVHAYKCKCSTQKISICKTSSRPKYICTSCNNSQFLTENSFTNGYGELLAKIDLAIESTLSKQFAYAKCYFNKPIGIDLARNTMLFAPEETYKLSVTLDAGLFKEYYKFLLSDEIPEYVTKVLVDYLDMNYLSKRLKNHALLLKDHSRNATRKERVSFFLKNNYIQDATLFYWDIQDSLHQILKTFSSTDEMLIYLMAERTERSIKRAFLKRYLCQTKQDTFDTTTAYVLCKTFKDPNFTCRLLSNHSFTFNSQRSESFTGYADMIISGINVLIAYYGEKAIVSLLLDDAYNAHYFDDVVLMIHLQKRDGILDTYFQKPRCNLMAIHDHLFSIENIREELLENKAFHYHQQHTKATGIWGNDLAFILPKETKMLCKWAITLTNCLCSYRDLIHNGQSIIFGIFKNNDLQYALELNPADNIEQLSGINNSDIDDKDLECILSWHAKYFKNVIKNKKGV